MTREGLAIIELEKKLDALAKRVAALEPKPKKEKK